MADAIYSPEYFSGFRSSRQEIAAGDIFCIQSAIMAFQYDPADSDFQRGYLAGLISYDKTATPNQ